MHTVRECKSPRKRSGSPPIRSSRSIKIRKTSMNKNSSKISSKNVTLTKRIAPINDPNPSSPMPSLSISIPRQPIIIRRTPSSAKLGLTNKEKSYLITTCQNRCNRYNILKSLASNAMRNRKVYTVYGKNMTLRKALNERGWVEKMPPENMNFSRLASKIGTNRAEINSELERLLLSNLVEKHMPNFIWKVRDVGRLSLELNSINNTLINKLKMDTVWTSKQGLCSSIKKTNWFHIEEVAEIITPRTFNDKDDRSEFIADFKLTACTSLLKWLLLMDKTQKVVCINDGNISLNIIVFALNRCKEYLLQKQHKDIDRTWRPLSVDIWNVFLRNYHRLIDNEERFHEDTQNKLPLYTAYAKVLLNEIQKYRPQMKCEGLHNVWIIKPAHCSRGRGIRLASKLGVITNIISRTNQRHVLQKYIEEPSLIYDTKFDIRQYYLVTSTFPLIVWMYKDCYLKFSTQKYNLQNYHESIHLTNNAVQKRYKNCQGRNADLPLHNMWSLERYNEYLKQEGKENVWNDVIYPGMKKCIISVMLSSQDHMSTCKNRFELYGCDFILDNDYNPWLIEINSCPDLNPTTKVTAKICPAVIEDIVKVVIDRPKFPKASTGNFECIYKQPITFPRMHRLADLAIEGCSLPNGYFSTKNTIIQENLDSKVDFEKACDIQDTLQKLKSFYTAIENSQKEIEKSASEEELEELAGVITSQIDVMLDKLPSSTSINGSDISSKKSSLASIATVVSNGDSDDDIKSLQSYYSEVDLKTVLRKPTPLTASTSLVDISNHQFIEINYNSEEIPVQSVAEKIINNMSRKMSTVAYEHYFVNRSYLSKSNPMRHSKDEETQSAANKILSFMTNKNQKEVEKMCYPLSDKFNEKPGINTNTNETSYIKRI